MNEINFLENAHISIKNNATGEQYILIEASVLGANLAKTLGKHDLKDGFYAIKHTPDIDKRITDLIDALIAIRYAHPQLMQLSLDISGWSK
jgi:hypothetical protein